ncbi:hypothetical protein GY45DRAFT_1323764 [Cubamyces sp. BRFM 1775]|nr:hypothetical protein GY45DRAFT_1323764 [Cubamyces sp. BRFM 1775]
MSAPSSSTNDHEDVIFPHPAHRAFVFNGQAMHVDIPRVDARAPAIHFTPGHGHTNVRLPTPLDTPGHGHGLFAVPSPLDTPGHGHTNVSLFSVASPHSDSPSTPTQRRGGRASRRSLFSSAADSDAGANQSAAGPLASLPEDSDAHSGAELRDDHNEEGDFESTGEDASDRA